MSQNLFALLQKKSGSNVTRRVAGGEDALLPQLKVGTVLGGLQINAAAAQAMNVTDGDQVAVADLPIFEDLGFPPAFKDANRTFYAAIYAAGEGGSSAKLNSVGSNFNFSNKNVHMSLGGDTEMNRYFKLGKGIYGIAQLEDGSIVAIDGTIAGDTPVKIAASFNNETAQFEPIEGATTVNDVYNIGKIVFPLEFYKESEKAQIAHLKGKKGTAKATTPSVGAAANTAAADVEEEDAEVDGEEDDMDDF